MAGREFAVLYTHQKRKKAKVWQDGILRISEQGTKAVLLGEGNKRLDQVHITINQAAVGKELESEKYLITIEEIVSSEKSNPVVINPERAVASQPDPRPSTQPQRRQPLKRKRTGFVPPRQASKRPSPEKENTPNTQEDCHVNAPSRFGSPLFGTPYSNTAKTECASILNMYGSAQATQSDATAEEQQSMRSYTTENYHLKKDWTHLENLNDRYEGHAVRPPTAGHVQTLPNTCRMSMEVESSACGIESEQIYGVGRKEEMEQDDSDLSRNHAVCPSIPDRPAPRLDQLSGQDNSRIPTDTPTPQVHLGTIVEARETEQMDGAKGATGNGPAAKRSTSRILALLGKGRKPFQPPVKQNNPETKTHSQTVVAENRSCTTVLQQQGSLLNQRTIRGSMPVAVSGSPIGIAADASPQTTLLPQGSGQNVHQSNSHLTIHSSEPMVQDHFANQHQFDNLPSKNYDNNELEEGHTARTAASLRPFQNHCESIPTRFSATTNTGTPDSQSPALYCDETREFSAPGQETHTQSVGSYRTGLGTDTEVVIKGKETNSQSNIEIDNCNLCKGTCCTCSLSSRCSQKEQCFKSIIYLEDKDASEENETSKMSSESKDKERNDCINRKSKCNGREDSLHSYQELVSKEVEMVKSIQNDETKSSLGKCVIERETCMPKLVHGEDENVNISSAIDNHELKLGLDVEVKQLDTLSNSPENQNRNTDDVDDTRNCETSYGLKFNKNSDHASRQQSSCTDEFNSTDEERDVILVQIGGYSQNVGENGLLEHMPQKNYADDREASNEETREATFNQSAEFGQKDDLQIKCKEMPISTDDEENSSAPSSESMNPSAQELEVRSLTDSTILGPVHNVEEITSHLQLNNLVKDKDEVRDNLTIQKAQDNNLTDQISKEDEDENADKLCGDTCHTQENIQPADDDSVSIDATIADINNSTVLSRKSLKSSKDPEAVDYLEDKPVVDNVNQILHYDDVSLKSNRTKGMSQNMIKMSQESLSFELGFDVDDNIERSSRRDEHPNAAQRDLDDCEVSTTSVFQDMLQETTDPQLKPASNMHVDPEEDLSSKGDVQHLVLPNVVCDSGDVSTTSRNGDGGNRTVSDCIKIYPCLEAGPGIEAEKDYSIKNNPCTIHHQKFDSESGKISAGFQMQEHVQSLDEVDLKVPQTEEHDILLNANVQNVNSETSEMSEEYQMKKHMNIDTTNCKTSNDHTLRGEHVAFPDDNSRQLDIIASPMLECHMEDHTYKPQKVNFSAFSGAESQDIGLTLPVGNSQQSSVTSVDTLDFSQDMSQTKDKLMYPQDMMKKCHIVKEHSKESSIPSQDVDAMVPEMELKESHPLLASSFRELPIGEHLLSKVPSRSDDFVHEIEESEQSVPEFVAPESQEASNFLEEEEHDEGSNEERTAHREELPSRHYSNPSSWMEQLPIAYEVSDMDVIHNDLKNAQEQKELIRKARCPNDELCALGVSFSQTMTKYTNETFVTVPVNSAMPSQSSTRDTNENDITFLDNAPCISNYSLTPRGTLMSQNQPDECTPLTRIPEYCELDQLTRSTWNATQEQNGVKHHEGLRSDRGSKQKTRSPIFQLAHPEELCSHGSENTDFGTPIIERRAPEEFLSNPASALLPHPSCLKASARRNTSSKSEVLSEDQHTTHKKEIYWKKFKTSGTVKRSSEKRVFSEDFRIQYIGVPAEMTGTASPVLDIVRDETWFQTPSQSNFEMTQHMDNLQEKIHPKNNRFQSDDTIAEQMSSNTRVVDEFGLHPLMNVGHPHTHNQTYHGQLGLPFQTESSGPYTQNMPLQLPSLGLDKNEKYGTLAIGPIRQSLPHSNLCSFTQCSCFDPLAEDGPVSTKLEGFSFQGLETSMNNHIKDRQSHCILDQEDLIKDESIIDSRNMQSWEISDCPNSGLSGHYREHQRTGHSLLSYGAELQDTLTPSQGRQNFGSCSQSVPNSQPKFSEKYGPGLQGIECFNKLSNLPPLDQDVMRLYSRRREETSRNELFDLERYPTSSSFHRKSAVDIYHMENHGDDPVVWSGNHLDDDEIARIGKELTQDVVLDEEKHPKDTSHQRGFSQFNMHSLTDVNSLLQPNHQFQGYGMVETEGSQWQVSQEMSRRQDGKDDEDVFRSHAAFHKGQDNCYDGTPSSKRVGLDNCDNGFNHTDQPFFSDNQISNSVHAREVDSDEVDYTSIIGEQSHFQEHDQQPGDSDDSHHVCDVNLEIDKCSSAFFPSYSQGGIRHTLSTYNEPTPRRNTLSQERNVDCLNPTENLESSCEPERSQTPELFSTQQEHGSDDECNFLGGSTATPSLSPRITVLSSGTKPVYNKDKQTDTTRHVESGLVIRQPLCMEYGEVQNKNTDRERSSSGVQRRDVLDLQSIHIGSNASTSQKNSSLSGERRLKFRHRPLIAKPTDVPNTPLPKIFCREVEGKQSPSTPVPPNDDAQQCQNSQVSKILVHESTSFNAAVELEVIDLNSCDVDIEQVFSPDLSVENLQRLHGAQRDNDQVATQAIDQVQPLGNGVKVDRSNMVKANDDPPCSSFHNYQDNFRDFDDMINSDCQEFSRKDAGIGQNYESSSQLRIGTPQDSLGVGLKEISLQGYRGNFQSQHHASQSRRHDGMVKSGFQTQSRESCGGGLPGREGRKRFRTPVSMMPSGGMHGDLIFPAADLVTNASLPQREIVIPVSFPNVSSYKQILTAAVKEHLNILLHDLSHRYHSTFEKADITSYTQTQHTGVGKGNPLSGGGGNPPCKHGQPSKMVCVKKDGPNKGRMFYACSNPRENQCKFFVWADQHAAQSSPSPNQPSQTRAKIALHDPDSIEKFARTNQIHLYCESQLSWRGNLNEGLLASAPSWIKKYRAQQANNTVKKLYIKLDRKEHSSTYAKDDLWIISEDLTFDPSKSFIAKSVFHGPSSSNEIEIEPMTGYSPSNWSKDSLVYGILACNATSELSCLDNLQENINPRTFPILPHLISCEPNSNPSFHGPAFVTPTRTRQLILPASVITELVEDTITTYHLNPDQSVALQQVSRMLAGEDPPVTLIHGVFGAGKSYLLAVMVLLLVKLFKMSEERDGSSQQDGWKVLISSTTNVAVDRILLGLLELGFEDFIRVGSLRKIAKPILPYSVHASDKENQEMKELQEMLKGDLTPSEKQFVRRSIERQRLGKNKEMLSKVKVIGVTCAACSFPCIKNLTLPVVLLDECSQMTEPSSLLPMARFGCEKLVLVGDPHQLDPTIQGSESGHRSGLEQTLFDRLSLMGCEPIMLRTQYRCHPCISSIANALFYRGQLLDGVIAEDRPPLLPDLPTLCFFNVAHGREASARDGSYFNETEASFVVFLISSMMSLGISPTDVGVITLYKAQVSRIRMQLQTSSDQKSSELKAIQISTVDAFQGGEKSIIILSCVRTERVGFIDSDKRTNVALTRAKNHLLIVGGMKMLSDNQLWGEIIHKCQERPDGIQDSKSFQKQWEKKLRELKDDDDVEEERPRRTREKRRKLDRNEGDHSPAMSLDRNDDYFVTRDSPSLPFNGSTMPLLSEVTSEDKTSILPYIPSPCSSSDDVDIPIEGYGKHLNTTRLKRHLQVPHTLEANTPSCLSSDDEELPCIDLGVGHNERNHLDSNRIKRTVEVQGSLETVAASDFPGTVPMDGGTDPRSPEGDHRTQQLDRLKTKTSTDLAESEEVMPLTGSAAGGEPLDIDIDAPEGHDNPVQSSHILCNMSSNKRRDSDLKEPSGTPEASFSYSPLENVIESDDSEGSEDLEDFPNFDIGNILL